MAIYPELVELDRIDGSIWFAREGKDSSVEYGNDALEAGARSVEKTLFEAE